jgi:chitin disaccharide deacetylase
MPEGQTNELLGYPRDARLLIINADDFGMCHAINAGILRSLREGVVTSTSLMVPCPWALHAMHLLQENPDIPFAVHLTLISDWNYYKWGPVMPAAEVPSLVAETGYFFTFSPENTEKLLARARLDEVEREFRAQIETVLAAGLKPTHLDWHCLASGGRADIFDITFGLAREYGLALRVGNQPFIDQMQGQGLPTNDHDLLDSYTLDPTGKANRYAHMLRELPAGLTEWAVHPAIDTEEMQAVEPGGRIRPTDFDFVTSSQAREIIEQEGIILLDYKPLQTLWQRQ